MESVKTKSKIKICNGRFQNLSYKWKGGHAVVQAVSCCPVTVQVQVQLQACVRYVARFFLEYFSLPPESINPPKLHTHLHLSSEITHNIWDIHTHLSRSLKIYAYFHELPNTLCALVTNEISVL